MVVRIMLFDFFTWIAEYLTRVYRLAVIGIYLNWEVRQEAGRSVGARAVGSGWEGL